MDRTGALAGKHLYFGNLTVGERQYQSGLFVGLALFPQHDREVAHDARDPLPVPDGSVEKIQSQDVFEHIPYDELPPILDDIHRALAPGGLFRLSVPDYRSSMLRRRCAFDENGNVLADLRMGGAVRFDRKTKKRIVEFAGNGNAHLWFPTYELVRDLISRSKLSQCQEVRFWHYNIDLEQAVTDAFPEEDMFVMRAPPNDMRSNGKPISIIVDCRK